MAHVGRIEFDHPGDLIEQADHIGDHEVPHRKSGHRMIRINNPLTSRSPQRHQRNYYIPVIQPN
jgi:hypothetical protein